MRCNRMHVHCNRFGGSTHSLRSPTALTLYPLALGSLATAPLHEQQRGQEINKRVRDAWEMKGTRMHAADAASYRSSHDPRCFGPWAASDQRSVLRSAPS